MKIFVGADHRGFRLKNKIIKFLRGCDYEVVDAGTHAPGVDCDYPQISFKVASFVAATKNSRGILACMTGIGHAIAANKVPGIRAALCYNVKAAELSRTHNNANVLIIGARFVKSKDIFKIVRVWLRSQFEGGRHLRRIRQIKKIEEQICSHKKKI